MTSTELVKAIQLLEVNPAESLEIFLQVAEAGNPRGYNGAFQYYLSQPSTTENDIMAKKMLDQALALSDPGAHLNLSKLHINGRLESQGIPKDEDLAYQGIVYAAERMSSAPAYHWLGQIWREGQLNKTKCLETSESFFLNGAKLGYIDSVFELGELYHQKAYNILSGDADLQDKNGMFPKQNESFVIAPEYDPFFSQISEEKHNRNFELSELIKYPEKAQKWFSMMEKSLEYLQQAADEDHPDAQLSSAFAILSGRSNPILHTVLTQSYINLESMGSIDSLSESSIDISNAIDYITKSAENGNPESLFILYSIKSQGIESFRAKVLGRFAELLNLVKDIKLETEIQIAKQNPKHDYSKQILKKWQDIQDLEKLITSNVIGDDSEVPTGVDATTTDGGDFSSNPEDSFTETTQTTGISTEEEYSADNSETGSEDIDTDGDLSAETDISSFISNFPGMKMSLLELTPEEIPLVLEHTRDRLLERKESFESLAKAAVFPHWGASIELISKILDFETDAIEAIIRELNFKGTEMPKFDIDKLGVISMIPDPVLDWCISQLELIPPQVPSPRALILLYAIYSEPKYGRLNPEKAFESLLRAVDKGFVDGFYQLAMLSFKNETEDSQEDGYGFLKLGAQEGCSKCKLALRIRDGNYHDADQHFGKTKNTPPMPAIDYLSQSDYESE